MRQESVPRYRRLEKGNRRWYTRERRQDMETKIGDRTRRQETRDSR